MEDWKAERLRKLKVLAERGCPGEKDAAKLLLDRLCAKYGISQDQLVTADERETHWFKYKNGKCNRDLLAQCIGKVMKTSTFTSYSRGKNGGTRNEIGIDCTAAEAVEIDLEYSFYSAILEKEMERLFRMFVQKNNIFNPTPEPVDEPEPKEESKMTREDIEMYNAIKRHTRPSQITDGSMPKIAGE